MTLAHVFLAWFTIASILYIVIGIRNEREDVTAIGLFVVCLFWPFIFGVAFVMWLISQCKIGYYSILSYFHAPYSLEGFRLRHKVIQLKLERKLKKIKRK